MWGTVSLRKVWHSQLSSNHLKDNFCTLHIAVKLKMSFVSWIYDQYDIFANVVPYAVSSYVYLYYNRADTRPASSQWEMSLQSNTISEWLGANL